MYLFGAKDALVDSTLIFSMTGVFWGAGYTVEKGLSKWWGTSKKKNFWKIIIIIIFHIAYNYLFDFIKRKLSNFELNMLISCIRYFLYYYICFGYFPLLFRVLNLNYEDDFENEEGSDDEDNDEDENDANNRKKLLRHSATTQTQSFIFDEENITSKNTIVRNFDRKDSFSTHMKNQLLFNSSYKRNPKKTIDSYFNEEDSHENIEAFPKDPPIRKKLNSKMKNIDLKKKKSDPNTEEDNDTGILDSIEKRNDNFLNYEDKSGIIEVDEEFSSNSEQEINERHQRRKSYNKRFRFSNIRDRGNADMKKIRSHLVFPKQHSSMNIEENNGKGKNLKGSFVQNSSKLNNPKRNEEEEAIDLKLKKSFAQKSSQSKMDSETKKKKKNSNDSYFNIKEENDININSKPSNKDSNNYKKEESKSFNKSKSYFKEDSEKLPENGEELELTDKQMSENVKRNRRKTAKERKSSKFNRSEVTGTKKQSADKINNQGEKINEEKEI
eukprot:CAMPEP_0170524070 /NCGR_PEP_ID=MMETSP0209-20121228/9490_1 /TAXON_ID=665100 ORGANISM="Litonotus pictus, Strain P1" /NCGR_SAMPLE_ID=MMETSP0209 /ASSEMBLY_ACC=CAM_ASM_000301 /LENGTH=496 /DNA_ID=CAMNT_0010812537 /DNA_START=1399 /DNA_END=2889 /DNA_ORIENTATION=-